MPIQDLAIQKRDGKLVDIAQPVVSLKIISARGPLTTRSQAGQGNNTPEYKARNRAGVDIQGRVIRAQVTAESTRVSKLELVMWNEDLALLGHPIMQKGTILEIAFGYTHYLSKKRKFKVHKIKGTTAKVAHHGELRIVCLPQTFDMHGRGRSVCYRNVTRQDIARKIGRRYGIPAKGLVIGQAQESPRDYFQVNKTDAQFLRQLAQEIGWTFQVHDNVLYFTPPEGTGRDSPIAYYRYFTDNQGWIKRFEPESSVLNVPGSVTVKSRDPATGKPVQATETIRSQKGKLLCRMTETKAAQQAGTNVQKVGKRVHRSTSIKKPGVPASNIVVNSPGKNAAQVKREAKTRMKNALQQAVKARLVLIGDPDLWIDALIVVDNVGKAMSGLYRIRKVIHTVDANGYVVDCKIRKEGVGSLGRNTRPEPNQSAKSEKVSRRLKGRVQQDTQQSKPQFSGVQSKKSFRKQ